MNTVDAQEVQHFSKDSSHWWDEDGPFAPLHRLNPVRMQYICEQVRRHYDLDDKSLSPFKDLRILDIGCGGGLVCEPLSRLGAKITGIDADENAIAVAKEHAASAGLKISYIATSSEDLVKNDREKYDVVCALEILEHVSDVQSFVENCVALCKPGGLIIFSTLNRTAKSYALGIVAAEYILRWVPQGTHQWKKFLRPSELSRAIRTAGANPKSQKGLIYNPLHGEFKISDTDLDVNYFMIVSK